MPTGLLQIRGELDLAQFWPAHGSDVDTIKVKVSADSFQFSPDPDQKPLKTTKVFADAVVKGTTTKRAINKNIITIRAQDIDGLELHIAAMLRGKGLKENGKKFRQHLGETSTIKLHDFLARSNATTIPCEVVTRVNKPSDVFDTYGRLIGDVLVTINGKQENINHWLVQKGWAFPAFYNSASKDEITTVRRYAAEAKKATRGIWKFLSQDVIHPDTSLTFRPPSTKPKPEKDDGPAVIPKLFRRQVRFHVAELNKLFSGAFRDYLTSQKDGWVKTSDFLKNPKIKPSQKSGNLSVLVDKKGNFTAGPGDIVFFEKPSTLIDSKGKKITSWAA
jgi:endonuclease YncB( thermonuclease family)